jgi:hypothetical protein
MSLAKVAGVVLASLCLASCHLEQPSPPLFDQNAWLQARSEPGDPVRLKMLPSLIKAHPLTGMSKDQLLALLGPSEIINGRGSDKVSYILSEEYEGIDPVEGKDLVLEMDGAGKVRAWRVLSWKKSR